EGVWDAKIIAPAHDLSHYGYEANTPGLGQTGPSIMIASNEARDFFAVQYTIGSPETADTLCDLYMQTRALEDAEWSHSTNLTETDNMNEDGCHLAPFMATTSTATTTTDWIFSMFWYEEGNTTPIINQSGRSVVYVATVPTRVVTGVEDGTVVNSFNLEQNYPNPFNPSTSIKYSVAERSNVSIKVYDMLGKEVANLVNTVKEAGSHEVTFNASNLASGMYVYTITAGNFTSSKKMMLMK
ncbi:MAG TPA: T9SS type A sorting domain-containing protein, partial [Ignavibacteriaceae bacterium]